MWLIKSIPTRSRTIFALMFSIVFLLNIDFIVLRSVRNTLAVADIGGGAHSIPFFELFGALPGAFILTWGIGRLLNRFPIHKVFFITLAFFVGFFLIFALGFYPSLIQWKKAMGDVAWMNNILSAFSMIFYVMAELWKTALLIILFWGFVNQHVGFDEAKKLYAPLMVGTSLGTMAAGPLIKFCTASWKWCPIAQEQWTHSLITLMLILSFFGAIAAFLYYRLWLFFSTQTPLETPRQKESFSFKENLLICWRSPQLLLMAWTVLADYIAYSLGEVIFLDVLKKKCPTPCDYCNFMGQLSFWSGLITVFSALFISPFILRRCRWVVAAMATPLCLLVLEGLFFIVIRCQGVSTSLGWTESQWIGAAVFLGSLQYCICRAAKYTLYDSSKELAFVMLPKVEKMRGKLIVDGICARLGRGSSSLLSLSIIKMCGGVLASSLIAGIVAIGMGISWASATRKLGRYIERKTTPVPAE